MGVLDPLDSLDRDPSLFPSFLPISKQFTPLAFEPSQKTRNSTKA